MEADKARPLHKAICTILDERTHTGWTTTGHTGTDVQIFASGPASDRFSGHLDNIDIAKIVFELLAEKK